jgi:hypothetical protein
MSLKCRRRLSRFTSMFLSLPGHNRKGKIPFEEVVVDGFVIRRTRTVDFGIFGCPFPPSSFSFGTSPPP